MTLEEVGATGHRSLLGRSPEFSTPGSQQPYCGVREWEWGPFQTPGKLGCCQISVATQEAEWVQLIWHRGFLCHWQPIDPAVLV